MVFNSVSITESFNIVFGKLAPEYVKYVFGRSGWSFDVDVDRNNMTTTGELGKSHIDDASEKKRTFEQMLGYSELIDTPSYNLLKRTKGIKKKEIGIEERVKMQKYEIHEIIKSEKWNDVEKNGDTLDKIWKTWNKLKSFLLMKRDLAEIQRVEKEEKKNAERLLIEWSNTSQVF